MSICCNIAVEFHRVVSSGDVSVINELLLKRLNPMNPSESETHLEMTDPNDFEYKMRGYSGFSVDDNGRLYDDEHNGYVASIGCGYGIPAGAFGHISYTRRWWSESYPEGPLPLYVVTILTLLSCELVKRVWYLPDEQRTCDCITAEGAHLLLDQYIKIGKRI